MLANASAAMADAADRVRHVSAQLEDATAISLLQEDPVAATWARERAARLERLWSHLWTALDVDDCFRSHHIHRAAA
jgi:hypothetical protein